MYPETESPQCDLRDPLSRCVQNVDYRSGDCDRSLGEAGEEIALSHLQRRRFLLLARNFRTPRGEVDLIAFHGDTLVFVEISTRLASTGMSLPADARGWLSSRQQARQSPHGLEWLAGKTRPRPTARKVRFDAVGVLVDAEGALVALHHIEGIT
jgi:putative endonuclease